MDGFKVGSRGGMDAINAAAVFSSPDLVAIHDLIWDVIRVLNDLALHVDQIQGSIRALLQPYRPEMGVTTGNEFCMLLLGCTHYRDPYLIHCAPYCLLCHKAGHLGARMQCLNVISDLGPGAPFAGDLSRQPTLLSLIRVLAERQPVGPNEKRSFVTPSKV